MSKELFFIFLASGLLLTGAEIFVPGGVLGMLGAAALLGAIVCGFFAFPGYGMLIAICVLILAGIVVVLWIKIFPRTTIGRKMTVEKDLSNFRATQTGLENLIGKQGVATSDLRPSGFATIEGKRTDVITRGEMIAGGRPIVVIDVGANTVVVKEIK